MIDISKEMGYYCKINPDLACAVSLKKECSVFMVRLVLVGETYLTSGKEERGAEYIAEQILRKLEGE